MCPPTTAKGQNNRSRHHVFTVFEQGIEVQFDKHTSIIGLPFLLDLSRAARHRLSHSNGANNQRILIYNRQKCLQTVWVIYHLSFSDNLNI